MHATTSATTLNQALNFKRMRSTSNTLTHTHTHTHTHSAYQFLQRAKRYLIEQLFKQFHALVTPTKQNRAGAAKSELSVWNHVLKQMIDIEDHLKCVCE